MGKAQRALLPAAHFPCYDVTRARIFVLAPDFKKITFFRECSIMDYVTDAARHRTLTAQYRTMAQRRRDEELCARYRGIADAYDPLAARGDQPAQSAENLGLIWWL